MASMYSSWVIGFSYLVIPFFFGKARFGAFAQGLTLLRDADPVPPAIVPDQHLHYIGDGAVLMLGGGAQRLPKSGHDGLAGAGVVREKEAKGLAGEHFPVDGSYLVG